MTGILGQFSLADEIDRFAPEFASGRYARTLLKSSQLRIVLIGMEAGAELKEHTAPGPITIQPVRGRFTVAVEDAEVHLTTGAVLAIDESARHSVRADEEGVFLLTIVWSGEAGHKADEEDV